MILDVLELVFAVLMLCVILLYALLFSCVWAWAQNNIEANFDFFDLISATAIEWGAIISLIVLHFYPARVYHEAPPLKEDRDSPTLTPIIFVPSLHTGSSIFNFMIWRLKKNNWHSLWHFQWKFFLKDSELLEDQLFNTISEVIEKTNARRFRIVNFGSSRPVVMRVLNRKDLRAYCDKWIAISSPISLSNFFQFISSIRLKKVYATIESENKNPDLQIIGENDFFSYPISHFGEGRKILIPKIGHFSCLLHSTTIQSTLKELSQ